MGQKVSPLALRIGYIENWRSLWFADKSEFAKNVIEDYKIREFIKKRFVQASVAKVVIERLADKTKIIIYTARPGVIIGRRGADIDKLRTELGKISSKEVAIDPREIKNPNVEAQLIAQNVSFQLAKRIAFRRAMKRAIENAMNSGAKGIKIKCSGRLNGVEMARQESYQEGKLPLHTFRAQIDYGFAEAQTTYGLLGIKVWVNKGEVIKTINRQKANKTEQK
ncbi:MAG: 30S ribosomal protein S3 [Omnitrophica WOR_2 bacterium GWF2_38_59]|nr:MAG: 30S ribosomal protein S3 [Omnitrophica WOR_2 bacterium GWA2_37_7]OGX25236.1 MAG: 30S ribosomal protein S3 [Omnitrophica WOR_2 bacterium GWF2_38_59]OGX47908.1 MAG: 30S ribosomal protein S3 [Omnitrophica WOR_2 bacterium RIFOXYA2_FULL_38_17]OGX54162.1 MAG: 30S ribosomal protein S3 [Omnitrophica WOR_2 bacterium RIFOXYA12_FULL_38_10]OGX56245.1 MAG: 30S ribosomal protein S3 [Omnitrophica WOR_2 bacterium RIFOXYC2_FULL_38_12]OGX60250.1 MAG: 30S ribosomal protein S3 [Omnitrophica WOR_2 bacteriu